MFCLFVGTEYKYILSSNVCCYWSGNAGLALLEFRARIDRDPTGVLANWNPNDTDPCMWSGVHCVDGEVQML